MTIVTAEVVLLTRLQVFHAPGRQCIPNPREPVHGECPLSVNDGRPVHNKISGRVWCPGFRTVGRLNMAKKSKKAKRSAPAKRMKKTTRKKKPAPKPTPAPVAQPLWAGFAGAKKEKKSAPKKTAPAPVAPSVWVGFGGKTEDH